MTGKRTIIPLGLLGLLMTIGSTQAVPSSRILGGSDATAGTYSHVVSVRVDGAHTCGGSIIANQFILTAGHCVSQIGSTSIGPHRVTTRVSSGNQYAGGRIVGTSSIVIHPSYGNFLHDICIIRLSEPLVFSDKINKIDLATEEEIVEEGASVSVAGWGLQANNSSPYKLQSVALSVLSRPECELQAGYGYESVLCLQHPAKTGICRGDYGAGIVKDNKLIGVASFAFGSCGTKYPDISSKVSYYHEWISGVIA